MKARECIHLIVCVRFAWKLNAVFLQRCIVIIKVLVPLGEKDKQRHVSESVCGVHDNKGVVVYRSVVVEDFAHLIAQLLSVVLHYLFDDWHAVFITSIHVNNLNGGKVFATSP